MLYLVVNKIAAKEMYKLGFNIIVVRHDLLTFERSWGETKVEARNRFLDSLENNLDSLKECDLASVLVKKNSKLDFDTRADRLHKKYCGQSKSSYLNYITRTEDFLKFMKVYIVGDR